MIYLIALLLFLILISSEYGRYMVVCIIVFLAKAMWWAFWLIALILAWVWVKDGW